MCILYIPTLYKIKAWLFTTPELPTPGLNFRTGGEVARFYILVRSSNEHIITAIYARTHTHTTTLKLAKTCIEMGSDKEMRF